MANPAHTEDGRFIYLPGELEEALIELAPALPAWTVTGSFLAGSTIEQYRAQLASSPLFGETISSLIRVLNGETGGYAVVRLGNIARALGTGDQFLRVATALLAEVARPFQPFRQWPLWKEIGTNPGAHPGRSTGTGYNAFHMDLVNATRPPDYTTLLCIRPDPLDGGPGPARKTFRPTPDACCCNSSSAVQAPDWTDAFYTHRGQAATRVTRGSIENHLRGGSPPQFHEG